MNALRGSAERGESVPSRFTAVALVASTLLLLAACAATPGGADPSQAAPDEVPPIDEPVPPAEPAHFVLSITAGDASVPTTTPPPTVTITIPPPPEPTIGPPAEGPPIDDGPTDQYSPRTPDRVVLACHPDAGTHPDPRRACESLRNAGGDFDRLGEGATGICTKEYAPVTVEALGYWGNRKVDYTETFSNRCLAAVGTDEVFDF